MPISPTITVSFKNVGFGLKGLTRRARDIRQTFVTVGIHKDEPPYPDGTHVPDVAFFNEFGTRKIPQRSFIRAGLKAKLPVLATVYGEVVNSILEKNRGVNESFKKLGLAGGLIIQNRIMSNIKPRNKISTIRKKKSFLTLIETRRLLNSVGFKVGKEAGGLLQRAGESLEGVLKRF